MTTLRQCEFFLLRYVPDAVKQECVNLGVVLLEGEGGFAGVRFAKDFGRVQCIDPHADLEWLGSLEHDLSGKLAAGDTSRKELLKRIEDAFSNAIQMSESKACLASDPAAELESLARIYLEGRKAPAAGRESSARMRVFRSMRGAFEQAGVWTVMRKKIAAEEYVPGDPLKLDCGYRSNGTVRLFHALALESGMDAVKALAFSFPDIRDGIRRIENAAAGLTAVVNDSEVAESDERTFAVSVLTRSDISIVPLSELPEIAERARTELKL